MTELAAIDIAEMRANAGQAADVLKAMSNQNRLLILCHLGEKEMSVNEPVSYTHLTLPTNREV